MAGRFGSGSDPVVGHHHASGHVPAWHVTTDTAARGETLHGFRAGPLWHDRQTASYAERSVDVFACGSWHIEHDIVP